MNENAIHERLKKAVSEKIFPGAVVGISNRSGDRKIISIGSFTYEDGSPRVADDTIYDLASITKSVPVALLTLLFIERGKLSLDDNVTKYIPEINIKNAEKGLIRHLLIYTYALKKNSDPNFSYEDSVAKDIFDFHFRREFDFLPGTQYRYGNAPANLLGIILERISGETLYDLAEKMIFLPLGMKCSTFLPLEKDKIPPTEIVSWRGTIQGVVHDETAFILQREGYRAGCAGLFSNVDDLLNSLEVIQNNGVFNGKRIFGEQTITLMTTNALDDIGQSHSMGWELNQPRFMGRYAHERMIGKTGFTGTCCIADLITGWSLVLLSNRTYPKRDNHEAFYGLRRDIADIIFTP